MWQTLILAPIYNILVVFASAFGGSLGWSVVVLTLAIKLILLPFSWKTHQSQILQKKLQPKIKQIKQDYPNQAEQSAKILALYKESGSNPFAGCLPTLIQLPILIGVYQVFYKNIEAGSHWLYTSVSMPENISTMFAGFDLSVPSISVAIIAGVVQAIQLKLSPSLKNSDPSDPAAKISQSMVYIIPVMIAVAGASLPASLSLYFIANAVITLAQETAFARLAAK